MAGRKVFYSFHFDNDVMRTQLVRNIGAIEGDKPVSPNEWEEARRTPGGIERWIDSNMKYKSCVIVLVGTDTSERPWIQYEIQKGWNDGKGLLGIYIHNLKDPRTSQYPPLFGRCRQGLNPFSRFTIKNGLNLANIAKCYDPGSDAYSVIATNIESWVEEAISIRNAQ